MHIWTHTPQCRGKPWTAPPVYSRASHRGIGVSLQGLCGDVRDLFSCHSEELGTAGLQCIAELGTWLGLTQGRGSSWGRGTGFVPSCQGGHTFAPVACLPRHIHREADGKQSSQDLNPCPLGMP